MNTICCPKPDILHMDYTADGVAHVNRHCNRCGSHWFGPADHVRQFTRAEWDRFLEAA